MVIMGFASRNSKDMQGMQGPDQMISNEILGYLSHYMVRLGDLGDYRIWM